MDPKPTLHRSLARLLKGRRLQVLFQPVVRLSTGAIVAYEALSRVVDPFDRSTDEWLDLVTVHGVRDEFELACMAAIAACGAPPGDALLFVNMSASLLAHPAARVLRDALPTRLVVELTEREVVDDYEVLRGWIAEWRESGVRLAIDDTGSGWSTLRHVVQLHPDFIKVDRSLISGLDRDRNCRALVSALAAFARESGATVIAEGVERAEEAEVLRDADVDLVQGWLFGVPESPWADASIPPWILAAPIGVRSERDRLGERLENAARVHDACDVVAGYLFRLGGVMPSVYLEHGGVLRCQAQRGLWQILDGMPPDSGVTGRTYATGEAVVLDDVGASADYLEAIPGVVSECCVPIVVDGGVVGSLNIESFAALSDAVIEEARHSALLLGDRLAVIGLQPAATPHQRLARHAAALSDLVDDPSLHQRCLEAAIEVSGMDSATIALRRGHELEITATAGPLAKILARVDADDLARLAALVDRVASCYTAGDSTGAGFVGTDALRAAGARAVAVVPLLAAGRRLGILVTASMLPTSFDPADAETIEVLGTHVASCLDRATLFTKLRDATERDALTGLWNRSAFDHRLTELMRAPDADSWAVLLADVDRFKTINDSLGHLAGDEILRAVGASLESSLEAGSRVYRIGGDEFAILIADVDADAAMATAHEVVDAADTVLAAHGASLSAGVAVRGEHENGASLLRRADHALYHAKRNGLRVRFASAADEHRGRPTALPTPTGERRAAKRSGNGD